MRRNTVWGQFERWLNNASKKSLLARRSALTKLILTVKDLTAGSDVARMIELIDQKLVLISFTKTTKWSDMIKPHMQSILEMRKKGMIWSEIIEELQTHGIYIARNTLMREVRAACKNVDEFRRSSSVDLVCPHYKFVVKQLGKGLTWRQIAALLKEQHGFEITADLLRYATTVITNSLEQASAKVVAKRCCHSSANMTTHRPETLAKIREKVTPYVTKTSRKPAPKKNRAR